MSTGEITHDEREITIGKMLFKRGIALTPRELQGVVHTTFDGLLYRVAAKRLGIKYQSFRKLMCRAKYKLGMTGQPLYRIKALLDLWLSEEHPASRLDDLNAADVA